MSTLNHEVFANATTPLWASASGGAGGGALSPFNVVNSIATPTTKTTIFDTNATGGLFFAPFGSNEAQAYGEVQIDITPAVHIKTNGKDIITATPSNVTITTPITIDNPQTSAVLSINTNSIGNPSNPDATVYFGTDYVNLGTTAYVGSSDGLVVYSGGFSNYAEVLPKALTFGTSTQTPISTTENFSTATIGVLGWTSQTGIPFDGYVWSSDNPNGDAQGGLTITDPAGSVKAVTNTNAPSSQKAVWMAGFNSTSGGNYTSYLEFPPIVAPIGTQVQVSWKQAGFVFSINVYKNDTLFSTALNLTANRPSPTNWAVPPVMPFTFTSTGLDTFYIAVTSPTGGSYTYTPYNMSDIVITIKGQVEEVVGGVGITTDGDVALAWGDPLTSTLGRVAVNDGSVKIRADDGLGGFGEVNTLAGSVSIVASGNVNIGPSGNINLQNSVFVTGGGLDMDGNSITNIANVNATQVFSLATYTNDVYPNTGFSNVKFQAPIDLTQHDLLGCTTINNQTPGGEVNIGFVTDAVNISNGAVINTNALDGNTFTALVIGGASTLVNLSNVTSINAKTGGPGASLNNFLTINQGAPLTQGLQLQYVVNWSGNKPNTMYIPPSATATTTSNSTIFGGGFTGNDYVSTSGYVLPPRSIFKIYNSGVLVYTATNSNVTPQNFTDTNFSPSSGGQSYSLVPLIV